MDVNTPALIADLKPPALPPCPCPGCGRSRDVRVRCFKCNDRPCANFARCGNHTGSALLALCIQCGNRPDDEPERWCIVVERVTVGKNAHKRPAWADVPMSHRVRSALKELARFGLRAVGLPNDPPEGTHTDQPMEAGSS